ncbi:MAG: S8 family serine peptidase, partial [Ornithinimicrobium sp.]|uniref:S8 family peptidase n=1 Tax=Ornithinimicrobium sp. TaxID=1977084 RepID=UPI0026DFD164
DLSRGQQKKIERDLIRQQKGVVAATKAKGGTVLAQTQYALNAVKIEIARKDIASLAKQPGVKAVLPVATYELDNATAVPFMGVPQVWEDTGFTGAGVKVAIIDTGIDYTHADFGGPGTVAAFEAADAADTTAADSTLFGPDAPRVKGGWDFVGDDYDAGDPGSTPMPDPNPLDCNGHGTHVAGSAAGSGVNADGTTYIGPYDDTVAGTDFQIGPGVAPEADLYALRVFGCNGSTDVTVEAIEWAVENGMDVINMSLGSSYGLKDDASALASTNAAAAGVVVVASAGNSGPNPYLAGAPGVGDGVVAVAAMDATAIFPGVEIQLPSGQSIPAISANGVTPPDGAAHTVVVLKDDPATTAENEALGCSLNAFTSNGIVEGGNQLAVTVRGTCARAARAVFGEQAGAAAVAMINTTADFPPYEGPITENPDDGVAFEVTIPFLGVRGVLGSAPTDDGDQLVAAEGDQVSYTLVDLDNPGFKKTASFSSGGPRSGDSALTPSVAAPGVSIDSAAVGTGDKGQRLSGTSMAAPMVTGVAALGVQAHPEWHGLEVADAIVTTADRDGVADYRLTLTGNGLVDAMQTVTTDVLAYGDALPDSTEGQMLPSLSFGFEEAADTFTGTKTVTVVNKGDSAQTYAVNTVASPQSQEATVTVSPTSITVPAGATSTVEVALSADATNVPSSTADPDDQHNFYEISGQVRLSAESGDLNVPYLLVPRSLTMGAAKAAPIAPPRAKTVTATLTNEGGAYAAAMDFYTWGLQDGEESSTDYDLRAAGVQSFDTGDGDMLLVFAVNNWGRYSNAASVEHDIYIDTDRNGKADKAVYVLDYGLVTSGSVDGNNAVFVQDLATGALSVKYFATSPTDSSTVLAPVLASQLGLKSNKALRYEVASFDLKTSGTDVMSGTAEYNPWRKALSTDGAYKVVAPGKTVKVKITADTSTWKSQKPLGQMIVVLDNAAGADEALLLGGR